MKATRYQDSSTGRSWLEFSGKPDAETIAALKANGWRWGGYRKAWHHPGRFAVAPAGLEVEDGGKVDWSAERAERLQERADKAASASNAKFEAVRKIADAIPFGQPILVGHHSERHARRDAERIHTGMGAAVELNRKAEHLASAAASSERHHAHLADPGTIKRRIDRLQAEVRKLERFEVRATAEGNAPWLARIAEALTQYRAQIAEDQEKLEAAGGLKADQLDVAVGDVVRINGHAVRIDKVNAKTYGGTIVAGGAAGMSGKWDRSKVTAMIAKGGAGFAPAPEDVARMKRAEERTALADADTAARERRAKEAVIWRNTHADYRGRYEDGTRTILVNRGGTCVVPLSALTEAELKEKYESALRSEARKEERRAGQH